MAMVLSPYIREAVSKTSYDSKPFRYDTLESFLDKKGELNSYLAFEKKMVKYIKKDSYSTPLEYARAISDYIDYTVNMEYKSRQSSLSTLLNEREGNCLAATTLKYLAFSRLLDDEIKVNVATPKGHIALLLEYNGRKYFVENTVKGGFDYKIDKEFVLHKGKQAEGAIIAAILNNEATLILKKGNERRAFNLYKEALRYNDRMKDIYLNLALMSNGEERENYLMIARSIETERLNSSPLENILSMVVRNSPKDRIKAREPVKPDIEHIVYPELDLPEPILIGLDNSKKVLDKDKIDELRADLYYDEYKYKTNPYVDMSNYRPMKYYTLDSSDSEPLV